jgi:hypothetical protein
MSSIPTQARPPSLRDRPLATSKCMHLKSRPRAPEVSGVDKKFVEARYRVHDFGDFFDESDLLLG